MIGNRKIFSAQQLTLSEDSGRKGAMYFLHFWILRKEGKSSISNVDFETTVNKKTFLIKDILLGILVLLFIFGLPPSKSWDISITVCLQKKNFKPYIPSILQVIRYGTLSTLVRLTFRQLIFSFQISSLLEIWNSTFSYPLRLTGKEGLLSDPYFPMINVGRC